MSGVNINGAAGIPLGGMQKTREKPAKTEQETKTNQTALKELKTFRKALDTNKTVAAQLSLNRIISFYNKASPKLQETIYKIVSLVSKLQDPNKAVMKHTAEAQLEKWDPLVPLEQRQVEPDTVRTQEEGTTTRSSTPSEKVEQQEVRHSFVEKNETPERTDPEVEYEIVQQEMISQSEDVELDPFVGLETSDTSIEISNLEEALGKLGKNRRLKLKDGKLLQSRIVGSTKKLGTSEQSKETAKALLDGLENSKISKNRVKAFSKLETNKWFQRVLENEPSLQEQFNEIRPESQYRELLRKSADLLLSIKDEGVNMRNKDSIPKFLSDISSGKFSIERGTEGELGSLRETLGKVEEEFMILNARVEHLNSVDKIVDSYLKEEEFIQKLLGKEEANTLMQDLQIKMDETNEKKLKLQKDPKTFMIGHQQEQIEEKEKQLITSIANFSKVSESDYERMVTFLSENNYKGNIPNFQSLTSKVHSALELGSELQDEVIKNSVRSVGMGSISEQLLVDSSISEIKKFIAAREFNDAQDQAYDTINAMEAPYSMMSNLINEQAKMNDIKGTEQLDKMKIPQLLSKETDRFQEKAESPVRDAIISKLKQLAGKENQNLVGDIKTSGLTWKPDVFFTEAKRLYAAFTAPKAA